MVQKQMGRGPMSRLKKRLQKLHNSPANVSLKDLVWVLEQVGFKIRRGGNHPMIATHPALPKVRFPIPSDDPVRKEYVLRALGYIDEVLEKREGGF